MRTIKKIVALTTGAIMLGATVMGAMAADLADYPAPFVEGCGFSGAIVVGEKAAAEDVVGAVDIASSLAVSGTTTTTSGTATTVTVSGEAVKIETNTKKLTLGTSYDQLSEVKATDLDEDDLPSVLADGVYTADDSAEYEYEQKLRFNDAVKLDFNEDSDYNDKENVLRIYNNKKVNFLNYTLDFTKDVESDYTTTSGTSVLDDMDDTTISILGNTYDITTAENTTRTNIKLVLMGGAIKDVMEQGEVKSFTVNDKEYEVEVTYIGGTTSKVKFKVNGEVSDAMLEDATYKLNDGTTIGVREILEEEAGEVTADQVEFYLGAEKLTLQDTTANTYDKGNNVEMDDEDVDDLYVDIIAAPTGSTKLGVDRIILSWYPDDEIFVTEDSDALFPGFESFKVTYEGFTAAAEEEVEVKNNGNDEIELVIPIKSGKATIPLLAINDTGAGAAFDAIGGEGSDEGLLTKAGANTVIGFNDTVHEFFVASDSGAEESYLLEVTDIDDTDGVDIKDAVSGTKYENKKNDTSFSIGDVTLKVLWLEEDNTSVGIKADSATGYFDRVYSAEGLTVFLPLANTTAAATHPEIGLPQGLAVNKVATTSYILKMIEEDRDDALGAGITFNATVGITGTTSKKTQVSSVDRTNFVNADYFEIGDTDEFEGYIASDLGTHVFYDSDPDQNTAKIIYHGGESSASVYVAEAEAGFGRAEGAAGEAVCKVSIPPAKLDSEVADVGAQNVILVGGPCANTAAAAAMGVASTVPECLEGFEEGKAMIKLYDTGKTAMVVAGMTALDTRRATRVLANYGDYALSGDEVEVSGTSLTDISVSAVTSE